MPVDTRTSTSKSNLMATSTGDKPTMDARMKSLEEANLHQSSKLDHLSQNQKSTVDTMMKQMQEMNESIIQLRLSTQTTTMTSSTKAPLTVNPLTTPIAVTLPPNTHIPSSYTYSNIPPIHNPTTQTNPTTPKPYFDHTHHLHPSTFMSTQSLPSYPSFTTPYVDHPYQQPLPSFMTIPNPSLYPTFPTQSNSTFFNPFSHQATKSVFQTTPQPNPPPGRLPRLEVPQFSGEGVIGWLFQIERYFELYEISQDHYSGEFLP